MHPEGAPPFMVLGHDHEGEAGHSHEGEEGHDHAGEGNPHVWYKPMVVNEVAEAVTAHLKELAPDAADYLDERHGEFENVMKPYNDAIATIRSGSPYTHSSKYSRASCQVVIPAPVRPAHSRSAR